MRAQEVDMLVFCLFAAYFDEDDDDIGSSPRDLLGVFSSLKKAKECAWKSQDERYKSAKWPTLISGAYRRRNHIAVVVDDDGDDIHRNIDGGQQTFIIEEMELDVDYWRRFADEVHAKAKSA